MAVRTIVISLDTDESEESIVKVMEKVLMAGGAKSFGVAVVEGDNLMDSTKHYADIIDAYRETQHGRPSAFKVRKLLSVIGKKDE